MTGLYDHVRGLPLHVESYELDPHELYVRADFTRKTTVVRLLGGGEEGLGGVLVALSCPGAPGFPGFNDTRVTPQDGRYLFTVPGVPPGTRITCSVSIDPGSGEAAGRVLTTANPQSAGPLGAGEMDLARDFGLKDPTPVTPATVRGTVFCDFDGDRHLDPNEPGIAAVPLELAHALNGEAERARIAGDVVIGILRHDHLAPLNGEIDGDTGVIHAPARGVGIRLTILADRQHGG